MKPSRCRDWLVATLVGACVIAAPEVTAQTAAAGRVEFAIGSPMAAGRDNRARPLAKGAAIYEGDLISTGAGRVQLRFSDGGFMSLQPQTQFKVEQYRYAGKQDGTERGIFNLVKGGMRTITGLIGKKENKNYRVHTKVATIGVRGTEYSLSMDAALHGSVASGQIDVCSAGGCAPFAQGDSFVVSHGAARPAMTLRKAHLPGPHPGEQREAPPQSDEGEKSGQQSASAPPSESAPPPGEEGAKGPLAGSPPPPPGGGQGFVQGDTTDNTGTSVAFKLTGSHFLAIATARYRGAANPLFGIEAPYMDNVLLDENGLAIKVGSWDLEGVKGGNNGFGAGGEGLQAGSSLSFHYAIGYPTLPQDIQWMQVNTPVIAYAPLAGTSPTGFFGSPPAKEDTLGRFLGGSLSVNLTASTASLQMNLEIADKVLSVSGPNMPITVGNMGNPATVFGGACSAGSQCRVDGFFIGPKAQNAALVYEFGGEPITLTTGPTTVTARGMAVFQKAP